MRASSSGFRRASRILRLSARPLALALVLAWTVFRFEDLARILAPIAPGKRLFVERQSLPALAAQHLALCAATSLAAFAIAFPLGLLASRGSSRHLREALDGTAAFGETFPTAALIALLVPALGYGTAPVALALALYGILPILRNTLAGLGSTPPEVLDAARGMGMTEGQALLRIRLPLALPLVLQGLRVSLISNIAAATIGAAVGAGGLGVPIVSGIRSFDTLLILKGSIPVALLALTADAALRAIEESLAGQRGA